MADECAELTDAELDRSYELHDVRVNGEPGGLGVQARDRTIRRLIEKIRRLRQQSTTE